MDANNAALPVSLLKRRPSKHDWKRLSSPNGELLLDISEAVETLVGGEDTIQIWPATAAWFLGPKAENAHILEELVDFSIKEHVDFRKFKYFPLDPAYVTPSLQASESYNKAVEKLRSELMGLTSRLKNSVPFFNFRSQGHMLWDTTIAANTGYIAALLYNQNNVASMASGVTLQLEREVGKDLCRMVGYHVEEEGEGEVVQQHTTERPTSWGHLPNGGTVANLEAMWAARCLKFIGLTLQKLVKERFEKEGLATIRDSFKYRDLAGNEVLLRDAEPWALLNLPVDEAIDLFDSLVASVEKSGKRPDLKFDQLFGWVKENSMEELGVMGFYKEFEAEYKGSGISPGAKWLVPGSRHYSWDKGANILGLGRHNLVKIGVDKFCRMDLGELQHQLNLCLKEKTPVIGVTVVFGTTQEGAVDDLDSVLKLRDAFHKRGLTFYVHIDGAWGGYFASALWKKDLVSRVSQCVSKGGGFTLSRQDTVFLQSKFSDHFMRQLWCMGQANSITLDPHKSGFCPYPAGGLLYRNGNIRKFLAQKAGYVSHGTGRNEEINLFGVDGSKPGAASAGVWLSHKVIGLHNEGYGLLLEQCTFSAGIMYALWVSLERSVDPFTVVPAIPVDDCFQDWTKKRIRKEILEAENWKLQENREAMRFITENGPDTLINCFSINTRTWDDKNKCWVNNSSLKLQKKFVKKFFKRCSHSFERPAMVDRGIQVILNSTSWSKETHQTAYKGMKASLGLDEKDEGDISLLINTCMSPWLRAQKTFKRIGIIIRNELYNAYGAIFDEPQKLHLVSPNVITEPGWNGTVFAELEASFCTTSLQYHAIGKFMFQEGDVQKIRKMAGQSYSQEIYTGKPSPLRIVTRDPMKVFDLMTGGGDEVVNPPKIGDLNPNNATYAPNKPLSEKLRDYSDDHLRYNDIGMPEVDVTVYFGNLGDEMAIDTKMRIKRVMRFHHLRRDLVDENDYPPSQEYFLYADSQNAYLSHCPNRYPDFQQQILLDEIPTLGQEHKEQEDREALYQEALRRGVVVYLPQVQSGGRPLIRKRRGTVSKIVQCLDPLASSYYNAVSWSDQGAFTGEMHSILLKMFSKVGKRWFDGDNINKNFSTKDNPCLYDSDGELRSSDDDGDYNDDGDETTDTEGEALTSDDNSRTAERGNGSRGKTFQ